MRQYTGQSKEIFKKFQNINIHTRQLEVVTVIEEKMAHKVAIYLPSRWGEKPIPFASRKKAIKNCLLFLTEICGGATESNGVGVFKNSTKIEIEPVTIVYAFSRDNFQEEMQKIVKFCSDLKRNLQQDAVAFEVNNILYLV